MTDSEYISKLFNLSAEQMGLPYVKTTAERLQKWSIDSNNKTFISLLEYSIDKTTSNSQADSVVFNLGLTACVETTDIYPEDNFTNEKVEYYQQQCDKIIGRFCNFVRKNERVNGLTYSISEVFKDPNYLGIGRVFTMTVDMQSVEDYCDDFHNEQTK